VPSVLSKVDISVAVVSSDTFDVDHHIRCS
jgi:hypothetical protein